MQNRSTLTVSTGTLSDASFEKRMQDIQYTIAHRAYELFASSGFTEGHDVSDWLSAESELLGPVPLSLSEAGSDLTLKAELLGFTGKDIEVRVEPRRVFIAGQREGLSGKEETGEAVLSQRRSSQVFRAVDLPDEIDPDKVKATFDKGTLRIVLPKKVTAEGATDHEKAA